MNWFHKICRNAGLMIHHVRRPDHETRIVRKDVRERKRGQMTLRRTTIEEIEIDANPDAPPRQPTPRSRD